ncbi:hypothetical protein [Kitasatospora sp. GP82]|uniref:hypothetical protein n=1 Tax=Kitasatospora sp. GP82 TaxID=3035089 RepID=UPI0024764DB7|nr:hypothetical protein [Kitasatospora sp. GP82]
MSPSSAHQQPDVPESPATASGAPAAAPGTTQELAAALHKRLDGIESHLAAAVAAPAAGSAVPTRPAWRRETEAEQRWAVSAVILVAVGLQLFLPPRLTIHPHWMLPALELVLLVALVAMNPHRRLDRSSRALRAVSLSLVAAISLANGWSAVKLVRELVHGASGSDAVQLLGTGGAIWATNVIAFALWYWEWDRGGPAARALGAADYPDLLFPQMQQTGIAPADWEPGFLDYLYVAWTNATAFSPTDTMPLSRWAKMLMLLQSAVSLLTVVLVVARAVNILQ